MGPGGRRDCGFGMRRMDMPQSEKRPERVRLAAGTIPPRRGVARRLHGFLFRPEASVIVVSLSGGCRARHPPRWGIPGVAEPS